MNTAAYYVFLYTYACLTNDFCSNAIKKDEDLRKEVLKLWDLLWGASGNSSGQPPGETSGYPPGETSGYPPGETSGYLPGNTPVVIPRKFFEIPSSKLTSEELAELKGWFTKAREYWGTLPDNHFEGEVEDKVARMIISVAIFGGSTKSISGVQDLLNDSYCTNDKNRIHMDCIADFGNTVEVSPGGSAPGGITAFRVDQGYLNFKKEGTRICLINGHYVPYYINHRGVFFVDMEYTIPKEHIRDAQAELPKALPVHFLSHKIRQLGEECGLHSLMAVLYQKVLGFNPFFVWHQEIVPGLDYKSFSKMRAWLTENSVDFTVLLRAQEYICYRIF